MKAGQLRHVLDLETMQGSTLLSDRGLSQRRHALALSDIPAEVTTLSGLELIRARQLVAKATHQVMLRYLPDLATLDTQPRFVFRDPEGLLPTRVLHIEHVADTDQRRIEMVALCREEKPPHGGST